MYRLATKCIENIELKTTRTRAM